MAANTFPSANANFNTYVNLVTPYLSDNASRLGVSAGNISALSALQELWVTAFMLSENPATATSTSKQERDMHRASLETLLRSIYHDIPESALTVTDRDTLNLPARDATPTPVSVPTVAPVVSVEKISHLQHILRFQNPETPESQAKPEGVATVEIYGHITESPVLPPMPVPMPSNFNFHHIAGTGKFLYTVNFEAGDVGKTIYYIARYRNSRCEVGPYSVMTSAVVA